MSDNSKNMTLEQRLVQNIKDTTLGSLIGDEDAITELTKRAVHEALFQKRTKPNTNHFGTPVEIDSPVIEAAKELAKATLEKMFEDQIKELMKNEEIRKALQEAIVMMLPAVLQGSLDRMAMNMAYHMDMTAKSNIVTAFVNAGIAPPQFQAR